MGRSALIDELRVLAERLPIPADDWHPYVAHIRRVRDDLLAALDSIERDEVAAKALERLIDGDDPPDHAASAALVVLAALPAPEGEHPFLDEIVPVLEAARVAQLALAVSGSVARGSG